MSIKPGLPLSTKAATSRNSGSRGFKLWPLALFLALLVLACTALWHFWPRILLSSIIWQRDLHRHMAAILQQVSTHPIQAGLSLTLLSLIYGIVHAVGPGHGKVVITTYLATHPSRLKSSLRLTFASAIVQGLVAVLLVTLLLGILRLSSRQLHQSSFWLEKGSFILLMLVGAILCWRALRQGYRILHRAYAEKKRRAQPLTVRSISPARNHQHDTNCLCGHQHVPGDSQLQSVNDWRTRFAVVLSMGLRPCSGAVMVLLFSKVIGVYWWGVLSALVMALGTSLTVSLVGLMVFYSREWAMKLSADRTSTLGGRLCGAIVPMLGGLILIITGFLLYQTSSSLSGGGTGPFGH